MLIVILFGQLTMTKRVQKDSNGRRADGRTRASGGESPVDAALKVGPAVATYLLRLDARGHNRWLAFSRAMSSMQRVSTSLPAF